MSEIQFAAVFFLLTTKRMSETMTHTEDSQEDSPDTVFLDFFRH